MKEVCKIFLVSNHLFCKWDNRNNAKTAQEDNFILIVSSLDVYNPAKY